MLPWVTGFENQTEMPTSGHAQQKTSRLAEQHADQQASRDARMIVECCLAACTAPELSRANSRILPYIYIAVSDVLFVANLLLCRKTTSQLRALSTCVKSVVHP